MTDTDRTSPPYPPERLSLGFQCPRCGAESRQWCVASSGRRATVLHADRTTPLTIAYQLGYSTGYDDGNAI